MRFKPALIGSFCVLIFLMLLLLSKMSLISELVISIIFGCVIILQLVLLLIDDTLSRTHLFITLILFLSLAGLVINLMGAATLTSFFLGGMFILSYLFTIVFILLHDWESYRMFDRMIAATRHQKALRLEKDRRPFVPVEELIDEPQHVRINHDVRGDWAELKTQPKKRVLKKAVAKKRVAKKKAVVRKPVAIKKTSSSKISKALDRALVSKEPHEMKQVLAVHGKKGTQRNIMIVQKALRDFKADKKWTPNNRVMFYKYLKAKRVLNRLHNK